MGLNQLIEGGGDTSSVAIFSPKQTTDFQEKPAGCILINLEVFIDPIELLHDWMPNWEEWFICRSRISGFTCLMDESPLIMTAVRDEQERITKHPELISVVIQRLPSP
ncbi:hypothetical protein CDAR_431731 [Caerostris darwini]|uniref:Uncharacterized protein n=1 Tax=Caerostris darwini TaxID=1538125 RepID=A0AAV4QS73_9ARAC|nr:hypothetical protein CDAR_431731 [Caerostris darwini]